MTCSDIVVGSAGAEIQDVEGYLVLALVQGFNASSCTNTTALSTTVSALGLPNRAGAITETMRLSVVVTSRIISVLTTTVDRTAAAAPNPTCASDMEAKRYQETSKTMAVGAGVGASLGTLLIATLMALVS